MDIEQTIRFILDMQARHEAATQKHEEQVAENSRLIAENSRQIAENSSQIAENSSQIQANAGMVRQLVDVSLSLVRHGEETDRRIRDLSEETDRRFRDTDYKLHALIDTVDKLVKRNGSAH